MFITKKYLPRRTLLRGLGTSIALPLLDAMIPAGSALAETAAMPTPRFGFVYFPHGAVQERWLPQSTGTDFELPQILQPFKAFKADMTLVSGLRNQAAEGGAVHQITPGTWLSCAHPAASGDPTQLGISADQVAARQLGKATPFPSLEYCVEVKRQSGACDPNFGCGFNASIAFQSRHQPLPMEHNPRKLFYRLFGAGDTSLERELIGAQSRSLLDFAAANAATLQKSLGAADSVLLNDYLYSIREIERQIQKIGDQDFSNLDLPEAPARVPPNFEDHINLMFDLMAIAWQADLTRVSTLMMAAEVSMLTYNQIGVSDAFHPLSHHQNNPDKLERLAKIQTYHSQLFARFLKKLQDTPDGAGTLLDHAILLYGSNMSNSDLHDADPLPCAVFGHAYGRLKGGQHLRYPANTPLANLLLTLLHKGGIEVAAHGNSTGTLAEV
ncbi:MAG: DUF1552 domain-containing protein [Pseudomonadales bacterium]|jgi:hypothetical protein|nr:DUF1552 domain-containing protein [Pseudomonadales bacterium]